jgi:hypothetical protein
MQRACHLIQRRTAALLAEHQDRGALGRGTLFPACFAALGQRVATPHKRERELRQSTFMRLGVSACVKGTVERAQRVQNMP